MAVATLTTEIIIADGFKLQLGNWWANLENLNRTVWSQNSTFKRLGHILQLGS